MQRSSSTPDRSSTSSSPEQVSLDVLRRRRAELRESMSALELALAAPAPVGQARWSQRVHVALVELSADFSEHVAITEGPDGLYSELARTAPRLSGSVAALAHEHALITDHVAELLARVDAQEGVEVDRVRTLGTALLGRLVRHRQRGSDLVYQAYEVDIGGET